MFQYLISACRFLRLVAVAASLKMAVIGILVWGGGQVFATGAYDFKSIAYLVQRDYDGLEKRYGEMFRAYQAGTIPDEEVYRSLDNLTQNAADGQEPLFDLWLEKYPKSYVALLARGYFYRAKAGRIRGDQYARDTSSAQFAGHQRYMELARADLLKAVAVDPKPTLGYLRLISVEGSIDALKSARRMRDLALKADPKSFIAHRIYVKYAAPKWQGSLAALADAERDAMASNMTAADKQRYRAIYHYTLGDEYERQDKPNEAMAMFWRAHEEGAEKESYDALERGAGVAEKNQQYDRAMKFLDELLATSSGVEVVARRHRGYLLETHYGQFAKAFADYSIAVEHGDDWAENRLGWWYDSGIHVRRDVKKAEEYWRRAAQKGNKTAIANLETLGKNTQGSTK